MTDHATPAVPDQAPAERQRLGFHVKRADLALSARKTELLRELDLTLPQACALTYLLGDAAKSCTHLARDALVTSQTMTGIVNGLEAKGYVSRHPSPDHGRVHLVRLTPEGEQLALAAERTISEVERSVTDAFGPDEQALLARLLDRAAEIAPAAGGDT